MTKTQKSIRRIQRFMASYALDTDWIVRLMFKILPHKPPYRLVIDMKSRQLNVLTLAIVYESVAFPIQMLMPDRRSNSDTLERIR